MFCGKTTTTTVFTLLSHSKVIFWVPAAWHGWDRMLWAVHQEGGAVWSPRPGWTSQCGPAWTQFWHTEDHLWSAPGLGTYRETTYLDINLAMRGRSLAFFLCLTSPLKCKENLTTTEKGSYWDDLCAGSKRLVLYLSSCRSSLFISCLLSPGFTWSSWFCTLSNKSTSIMLITKGFPNLQTGLHQNSLSIHTYIYLCPYSLLYLYKNNIFCDIFTVGNSNEQPDPEFDIH